MIALLRIQDFQSIAAVDLKLGKLTVITGPSNSGKSAVVRALRHALTNPRGSGIVRVGAKEAQVALVTAEGRFAWHKPIKGGASYRVPGAVHTVNGTGPDSLPEPARAALNLDPDVQISDQFEGPFLLTRTASQAAALLGSLSRADRILQAVKYANGKERDAGAKAKTLQGLHDDVGARLSQLDWWAPIHGRIQALVPEADELYRLNITASQARMRLDNANYTAAHARALRDRLAAANALVLSMSTANQAVVDLAQRYDRVAPVQRALRETYQAAAAAAASVNEATTHQTAALERLAGLIQQLPGTDCPTCGQPITEDAAHHIVGVHP